MEQESSKVNRFQPLPVVCRPEVAVSHYPQIQWLCQLGASAAYFLLDSNLHCKLQLSTDLAVKKTRIQN